MIYLDALPTPICLPLIPGETVAALRARLREGYPWSAEMAVSVWGKEVGDGHCICAGERVVFTRALLADPKQVRAHKVDNKPRKGWVARVSKFSLSQLKAEASQVSLLLCLCLCLPLTRPLWAQEVGQEAGHEVLPAVATGEAITDPTTTPTREVAASPLLPSAMATVAAAGSKAQEIAQTALGMLGIRYKFGGNLPEQGFDCSGLVRYVFKQVLGVELPRTAKSMSAEGVPVLLADLQVGDLVFFNTRKFAFSHVGIYLGEQRFVHAPNRRGTVNIEEIDLKYWRSRFNGARRLVNQQQ